MALEGTLKNRDGKLYVLYTFDEDSEPVRQRIWYRVLGTRGTGYGGHPESGDLTTRDSAGDWRARNPATHRLTGYVSTGTGSTLAELVERVDIPPPATGGKALRWYQGRWEKLIAKGWVPAGEGKTKGVKMTSAHTKSSKMTSAHAARKRGTADSNPGDLKHWKVKFTRRGMEPPRPFGKTSAVVCAVSRKEALEMVPASPGYPITASITEERVTYPYRCRHETPAPREVHEAHDDEPSGPKTERELEADIAKALGKPYP